MIFIAKKIPKITKKGKNYNNKKFFPDKFLQQKYFQKNFRKNLSGKTFQKNFPE